MIANFRIKTTFKYIIVIMFLFLYKCGYSREIKVGYLDFNNFVVYEKMEIGLVMQGKYLII